MLPTIHEWFVATDWTALAWRQIWQIAVVAVLVQTVVLVFAPRRPHLAYLFWMVVIIKCVTPPIWSSQLGVFGGAVAVSSPTQPVERPVAPPTALPPSALPTFNATAATEFASQPATLERLQAGEAKPARTNVVPAILLAAWALGTCAFGTVAIRRWRRYQRSVQRGRLAVPDELIALAESVAAALGVRQRFNLAIDEQNCLGPAALGVFRPAIVLPRQLLTELSHEQLRAVLAHELIHVRRHDPAAALLQVGAQVIWWFHPLVWWANRQATRQRELACDEEAVTGTALRSRDYVNCLVDVLQSRLSRSASGLMPAATATPMTKSRIVHLLSREGRLWRRTPVWCWLVAAVALLAVLPGRERVGAQHATLVQAAVEVAEETDANTSDGDSENVEQDSVQPVTITGQVFAPDGTSVAGATVYLVAGSPQVTPSQLEPLGSATADKEGWYEFPDAKLPVAGEAKWGYTSDVVVFATAEGHGLASDSGYMVRIEPNGEVRAMSKGDNLLLFTGTATLDLNNASQTPRVDRRAILDLRLTKPTSITGRVVNEAGQPLAGVEIRLADVGTADSQASARLDFAQSSRLATTTDADGRWQLAGLATDTWVELEVLADGFAPTSAHMATTETAANRPGFGNPLPVGDATIALAEPKQVELLLADEITGQSVGNQSLAVAGTVGDSLSVGIIAATDEDGLIRLSLPPAKYNVMFNLGPASPYQLESKSITVAADSDEQLVALELTPSAAVEFDVVDDATGQPIVEAAVRGKVAGETDPRRQELRGFFTQVTDRNGQIRQFVKPATAEFEVFNVDWKGYKVANPLAEPVELKPGETFAHTFRLKKVETSKIPRIQGITDGLSEEHLRAVESLYDLGAYVSSNIRGGGANPEIETYVVITQHWTGDAEGLRWIRDLDGTLIISFTKWRMEQTADDSTELPLVTDEWLAALEGLKVIQLQIPHSKLTNAGLTPLATLVNLQMLMLNAPDVTNEGLRHLGELAQLRILALNEAAITDAGIQHLGGLDQLMQLRVDGPHVIASGLRDLPSGMRSLRLERASDGALRVVADSLPELIQLGVGGADITDAGMVDVARLEKLGTLDLFDTSVTATGLELVTGLPLATVRLTGDLVGDATIEPLGRLSHLQELWLSNTQVTDDSVAALRAVNRRLRVRTSWDPDSY